MRHQNSIPKYFKQFLLISLLSIAIGSCSSSIKVPLSSFEQDQLAKTFQISPGRANLYFIRDESTLAKEGIRIIIKNTEIGTLAPDTYLLTRAKPKGIYEINAELLGDTYAQKVKVELNQNYFLRIQIINRSTQPEVKIMLLSDITGRASIVKIRRVASTLVQTKPKK